MLGLAGERYRRALKAPNVAGLYRVLKSTNEILVGGWSPWSGSVGSDNVNLKQALALGKISNICGVFMRDDAFCPKLGVESGLGARRRATSGGCALSWKQFWPPPPPISAKNKYAPKTCHKMTGRMAYKSLGLSLKEGIFTRNMAYEPLWCGMQTPLFCGIRAPTFMPCEPLFLVMGAVFNRLISDHPKTVRMNCGSETVFETEPETWDIIDNGVSQGVQGPSFWRWKFPQQQEFAVLCLWFLSASIIENMEFGPTLASTNGGQELIWGINVRAPNQWPHHESAGPCPNKTENPTCTKRNQYETQPVGMRRNGTSTILLSSR